MLLVLLQEHNLEFIAAQNSPTSWLREIICKACDGYRSQESFLNTSGDFLHACRVENCCFRCCNNYSKLHQTDRETSTWHVGQPQNLTFDLSSGRLSLEHIEERSNKPTFKLHIEITKRPLLTCRFVKLWIPLYMRILEEKMLSDVSTGNNCAFSGPTGCLDFTNSMNHHVSLLALNFINFGAQFVV